MRNLLVIFVNGVLQEPGKSYDFNGGTTFTFINAPKKKIILQYFSTEEQLDLTVH